MGFVHVAVPGPQVNSVIGAMLALGVLSSGLACVLNPQTVAAADSTSASSVTYLTPVVAAAVGVSLLGEELTWNQPVGALIVLLGIAVAQGRRRSLQRRAAGPPAQVLESARP